MCNKYMENIYLRMIEIKNWKFETEHCTACINISLYGISFYNSFNDKTR